MIKKVFVTVSIIIFSICIFADMDVQSLEKEAFDIFPQFGKAIIGEGYLPDIDFNYINENYKQYVNDNNPFTNFAYGITFFYKDNIDSAMYYFDRASIIANINYTAHLRLFELYKIHDIYDAMNMELKRLINIKYKIGALSVPDVAQYLNIEAVEAYNNGIDPDIIDNYFYIANRLDPYNNEIIFNYLKFSLKTLRFGNISMIFSMLRNSFQDIINQFILLYNTIKFIRYLLFIFFVLLSVLLFIKNINKIFFSIEHNLSNIFGKFQKKVITFFIIFFPLILEIHPIIWIFYITFLNYFFIRRREKFLLGIILIFIAFMPAFFYGENHILSKLTPNENLNLIIKAQYFGWNEELLTKLDSLTDEQPLNTGLFFAKAMLYKKGEFFDKAEDEYFKILRTGDPTAALYNNLGNIMYFKKMYSKAKEYYQKAIEMNPKNANAYFNLAQVYLTEMKLNDANEYINKAASLNSELINGFLENLVEGYKNTELIDSKIPDKYLWNEFFKKSKTYNRAVIMGIRLDILSFISIITLLLSGILGSYVKHRIQLIHCDICGRVMFKKQGKEYNNEVVCEKCLNILTSTISDSLRVRKYESLKRLRLKRHKRFSKIMSFVFPGAGEIINENLFKANIIILITLSFILLFFSKNIFIIKNPHIAVGIVFPNNIIISVFILFVYIISLSITRKTNERKY